MTLALLTRNHAALGDLVSDLLERDDVRARLLEALLFPLLERRLLERLEGLVRLGIAQLLNTIQMSCSDEGAYREEPGAVILRLLAGPSLHWQISSKAVVICELYQLLNTEALNMSGEAGPGLGRLDVLRQKKH